MLTLSVAQTITAAGVDYSDCIARCWGYGFSGQDASPVSHLAEPRYTLFVHSDGSFLRIALCTEGCI